MDLDPRADGAARALTNDAPLEVRITDVGRRLGESLAALLDSVEGAQQGPQKLATSLGLDKVLTSRALRAARHRDPIAVMQLAPGPDPMRRLLHAAQERGAPVEVVAAATRAVDDFDRLIREEAGDRGAFAAILSSWLPDARAEFESRQKQAAFKTMSLLKGSVADVNLATVVLHPAPDGRTIDVLWLMGLIGLTRLRPGAPLKFVSRRVGPAAAPRRSTTIFGAPIEGTNSVLLRQFCDARPASIDLQRAGDVNHYMVAGDDFGQKSRSDLIIAEANLAELPKSDPEKPRRKGFVFAEISTPVRALVFDAFVHRDIYDRADPSLAIYDTCFDGVADVNDPTRDIDRLDMLESIQGLGAGLATARIPEIPRYAGLLEFAFDAMKWEPAAFRGHRCRIEYPIYGSQVTMAFAR